MGWGGDDGERCRVVGGLDLVAQMVARSASRLVKLRTGWWSWVCLRAALASAASERSALSTGLARFAAAGLSLS